MDRGCLLALFQKTTSPRRPDESFNPALSGHRPAASGRLRPARQAGRALPQPGHTPGPPPPGAGLGHRPCGAGSSESAGAVSAPPAPLSRPARQPRGPRPRFSQRLDSARGPGQPRPEHRALLPRGDTQVSGPWEPLAAADWAPDADCPAALAGGVGADPEPYTFAPVVPEGKNPPLGWGPARETKLPAPFTNLRRRFFDARKAAGSPLPCTAPLENPGTGSVGSASATAPAPQFPATVAPMGPHPASVMKRSLFFSCPGTHPNKVESLWRLGINSKYKLKKNAGFRKMAKHNIFLYSLVSCL